MNLGDGTQLGRTERRIVALAVWLFEHADGQDYVSIAELAGQDDATGAGTLLRDLQALEAQGIIELRLVMPWTMSHYRMTTGGVMAMEQIEEHRNNPGLRRRMIRQPLLQWLYNENVAGRTQPNITGFVTSDLGHFFHSSFSEAEAMSATSWLKDEGLITGTGVWGGGIPRPRITTKGERLIESGRSVNDDIAPAVSTSVSVTGDGNVVQAGSPHALQTATVSLTSTDRKIANQVADLLEQTATLGQVPDVEVLATNLRTSVNVDVQDPTLLRRALTGLVDKLADGTGTAIGAGALALAHPLLLAHGLAV